jgi:hypothetical protein
VGPVPEIILYLGSQNERTAATYIDEADAINPLKIPIGKTSNRISEHKSARH